MRPPELRWLVHEPLARDAGDGRWDGPVPAWLAQLRGFRAELLHCDGLRPTYRRSDGRFVDDDPCDPFAYHLVATVDDGPVAALRMVPLAATRTGVCERLFGAATMDKVLAALGVDRTGACEGSGWAIRPGRRGAGTIAGSLAATQAVSRELGLGTMLGAVGTRNGALYRVMSVGCRRVPDVTPLQVPALADDVTLVHATLDDLRAPSVAGVDQLASALRFPATSPHG